MHIRIQKYQEYIVTFKKHTTQLLFNRKKNIKANVNNTGNGNGV